MKVLEGGSSLGLIGRGGEVLYGLVRAIGGE